MPVYAVRRLLTVDRLQPDVMIISPSPPDNLFGTEACSFSSFESLQLVCYLNSRNIVSHPQTLLARFLPAPYSYVSKSESNHILKYLS